MIFVFRVGLADEGTTSRPALVVDMVVKLRELVIVWPLIVISTWTVCPAVTVLSNAVVRQTNVVDVDSYGMHLVAWGSLKAIEIELLFMSHGN